MIFDDENKSFTLSARELAEDERFHRIGFERGEGWRRLSLGSEVHARVQQARHDRNPAYRSEVPLQADIPIKGWTAILTGRLDGCFPDARGGWTIEEFKSTILASGGARTAGPAFERDCRQLLVYCSLWRRLGHAPVRGALVYVDITSGEECAIEVPYDAERDREIERRLGRLLQQWLDQADVRRAKAEAAATLPFPHAAPRPVQARLMEAVRDTVDAGGHLLAEAPTGSGKTAGVLHPALAAGLAADRQVVFLTAKTLQQRMAVTALQAMNHGAFRTVQIRAKEKMCANDQVVCHEDFCRFARHYPEKMVRSGLLDRLLRELPHADPDIVFEAARAEEVCPFEVQLEVAERADALVADYNYVFEPGVALRHLAGDELHRAILLVDESHNLPDRARQIFSPELCEEEWTALRERLRAYPGELFTDLIASIDELRAVLTSAAAESLPSPDPEAGAAPIAEIAPPAEAIRAIRAEWEPRMVRYLAWKQETKLVLPDDPVMACHFTLARFVAVLGLFGPDFTCVVERRSAGIRLALVCLDPARALAPVFHQAAASVLLSATLAPADALRRTLGLKADRSAMLTLPPPFPPEHRKVLIVPQVRTTYKARAQYYTPIATLIAAMSDAHVGNALALFPSYTFLAEVASRLPVTRARMLIQRSDFSDAERRSIFQVLAAPPPEGILLLAVVGGMYAEGVDYPGEHLSSVFVVSPALPQVTFERELLRKYYDEREEAGFDYAYLQPGMRRVVQAAGRLIRSETDRGVIALLCRRFLEEPYVSRLPRDWYHESAQELVTADPAAAIRAFFDHAGE